MDDLPERLPDDTSVDPRLRQTAYPEVDTINPANGFRAVPIVDQGQPRIGRFERGDLLGAVQQKVRIARSPPRLCQPQRNSAPPLPK